MRWKRNTEKNKYIDFPDIGIIRFQESRRARRIIISVKSPTDIRVSVPMQITIGKAESFVIHKLDWIKKHQEKFNNKKNVLDNIDDVSIEQKRQIINRVNDLAHQYKFKINKISLRKMTTRWGSCSPKNNISLNIGLVALPEHLKDYIIVHELVHTKIKNHSSMFWNELGQIIPNSKSLSRELKRNFELYKV